MQAPTHSMQSNYSYPQYTLPGVMHYLQTEFTKNERDRITWELERSEMRSYIAKLEGENRDLRHKVAALESGQAREKSKHQGDLEPQSLSLGDGALEKLTKARENVQENVKEIIYLLNGPNVTTQLASVSGRGMPLHTMEELSLNTKRPVETQRVDESNGGARPIDESVDSLFSTKSGAVNPQVAPVEVAGGAGAGMDAVAAAETRDLGAGVVPNTRADTCHKQVLKVFKNNILATLNGTLKYYIIDEDSNCKEMEMAFGPLLKDDLLDIFWLNNDEILSLDQEGIKLWNTYKKQLAGSLSIFDAALKVDYKQIINVDYKNKWLLLTTLDTVLILELSINNDTNPLSVHNVYRIPVEQCHSAILGITEKSFIAATSVPLKLTIYNFDGEVLQTVDMSKDVFNKRSNNDINLFLNKDSSKLLIQLKRRIIFYSFEQKRIVFQKTLRSKPTAMYFKYASDVIGIAYSNGVVEVRKLANFNEVIFHYSHVEPIVQHTLSTTADDALQVSIEATTFDGKPVLLSLGNNILKLETTEL